MKIAVTGANGFIGRKVVENGIAAGHHILAVVRKNTPSEWHKIDKLQVLHCDLLDATSLASSLSGCDALIDLAAVMHGNDQHSQTLKITRNVISCMEQAGVKKLVGLSSISILDYTKQQAMAIIDEDVSINQVNEQLGPYALMKRDQEDLYKAWKAEDSKTVIVRPGIVYDDQQLSNAHVGFIKSKRGIAAIHEGFVPIVHVNTVAKALITSAEYEVSNEVIHLVDDDLPNQKQYIDLLKRKGVVSNTIPLPWKVFSNLMALIRLPLKLINKIPDSFRLNSIAARQKPFQFSNDKAKQLLNWQPKKSLTN
ncbi:NAD-dependent epimerase/dehydratase family protein [Agarilytica rhodophyticola]|uniref:NAD-dependent epimerase/dehydratase family protein n=1 Tax=Agarilytica rhodophyticola TaxID=1737490 RepID=UPI000B348888|nr:NAD(P)-dependent oxidoreductase [Agarilytica rhodophyticola]